MEKHELSTEEKLQKTFDLVKNSDEVSTGKKECPNRFGNLTLKVEKGHVLKFLEDLMEIGVATHQIHNDERFYVYPVETGVKTVEIEKETYKFGNGEVKE